MDRAGRAEKGLRDVVKSMNVDISEIVIPKGRRGTKPEKVASIAASIKAVGLLQPVGLTEDLRLIFGRHRVEACKSLGHIRIAARIIDADALHLELAEIDENLERAELTALEHSEQQARRKEIYEAMHPQAKHGGDRKSDDAKSSTQNAHLKSFAEDAAEKLGVSESTVRRDVALVESLPEEVRDAVRDTPVADNKSELKKLAALPPKEQAKAAKAIESGKAETVKEATADKGVKKPSEKETAKTKAVSAIGVLTRVSESLGVEKVCHPLLQTISNTIRRA